MSKFSDPYVRYIRSSQWKRKSKWTRSLTRNRCCFFPFLRAEETHHLTYYFILNLGFNSFGLEIPGWHLVPLNRFSHRLLSVGIFWMQPIRFVINFYLRLMFIILVVVMRPLLLLLLTVLLVLSYRLFA